MSRALQKVFNSVITAALICGTSVALESEYKNSLEKVELQKTSDSSYNINIYTQKHYSEPVKIIKKSDLNYYILLPETKNLSQTSSFNTSDIRSVSAKTYPYAAQDIENGYTKININTTKPINFTVNTQTKGTIASKSQKKNLEVSKEVSKDSSKEKIAQTKPNVNLQPKKETQQQALQQQKTTKPVLEQNSKLLAKIEPKKIETKKSEPKAEVKKTDTPKTAVKKAEIKPEIKQQPKKIEQKAPTKPKTEVKPQAAPKKEIKQPVSQPKEEIKTNIEEQILEDQQRMIEELQEQRETSAIQEIEPVVEQEEIESTDIISSIKSKLQENSMGLRDLALMILAGLIGFIVVVFALTRKPKASARLKNKSELLDTLENESLVPKKPAYEANKEKVFIIKDESVMQPTFEEVDETDSYIEETAVEAVENENDYEIIQKILKDDAVVETAPQEINQETEQEIEQVQKQDTIEETEQEAPVYYEEEPVHQQPEVQTQPAIVANNETIQQQEEVSAPVVLSRVEIAPERGFMCIKYDNNVSLMGYMFDDVFVLHNFKRARLNDYAIKFRITERDDSSINYIIKVDDVKLIAKVTPTNMKLEVLM